MYKYILLILIFSLSTAFAETKSVDLFDDLQCEMLDGRRMCKDSKGKPFNGNAYAYFNKSKQSIMSTVPFVDGVIHGIIISYHENGGVMAEYLYKNGVAEGWAKEYYPNGVVRKKLTLHLGKVNGLVREYYDGGELKSIMTYANGLRQGTGSYYHIAGGMMRKIDYYNDKRNGSLSEFDEKGKLFFTAEFLSNKMLKGVCVQDNKAMLTNDQLVDFVRSQKVVCKNRTIDLNDTK